MVGQIRQPWERALSGGTAQGACGHRPVSDNPPAPQERTLLRLDGQYGNGAVLSDVAGFAFVTRGKDYHLLDHPLHSGTVCTCPLISSSSVPKVRWCAASMIAPRSRWDLKGPPCRVVVATHPAGKKKSPIGVTRAGVVYELFFTNLPQHAFTACDVVELYLHRGAFEPPSRMKTRSSIPTGGAVMRPGDRNAGR